MIEGKEENERLWTHNLEHVALSVDAMDAIGDDYVEKSFKNEGFVKFIFDNARMVTHTHTQSLEQIKDDPENWFSNLHPSDKAYAVTQGVNNEMVWAWT